MAYAGKFNSVVVGCGKASAGRKDRGFSCVPAWDRPGESVLGTAGSARDCKIITKTLTKALKKVSRKPVIKFVCEAYGDASWAFTALVRERAVILAVSPSALAISMLAPSWAAEHVMPPANLSLRPHALRMVFSSATCEGHVASLLCRTAPVPSCALWCARQLRLAGGPGLAVVVVRTAQFAKSPTSSNPARVLAPATWSSQLRALAVAVVQGAYSHSRSLCSSIAGALNAIIEAGTADFTCN